MPISMRYKELILGRLSNLTQNQRRVAEYLMDNPQEAALSSITKIARTVKVSQATVFRLAKALGYRGFLHLKSEMLENLRRDLTPLERFQAVIDQSQGKDDVLLNIARQDVENISGTLNIIDKAAFDKAVDLIISSHHIYTMGLGISSFLSQITAYLLKRVTLKASALSHGSVSFIEQIISIKDEDLIIAFSLPPYSLGTIEAAQYARDKNINVISITDKMTAPIVQYSNVIIQTRTESMVFANSLGAIFVVICALATEVALRDRKRSSQALSKLEEARRDYELVVDRDFFQVNKKFY